MAFFYVHYVLIYQTVTSLTYVFVPLDFRPRYPVFLPNRQRSVLNGKGCPAIFSSSDNACPEDRFCARIQQAYQRPSCLRSAHPSAVFQPVRLTTQPRGEIYEISISKQHPALCMQPEGIISGDFSTESVHQLCTEYACPSLDCRTDIS